LSLFDLSIPENRRTSKRADSWESVPEERRPRCLFCNELLPFTQGTTVKRWLLRKVCNKGDDKKEVKCLTLYIQQNNAKRPKIPEAEKQKPRLPGPRLKPTRAADPSWKKPETEKPKPRVVMSQTEAERLDAEQLKINIEIHQKTMSRCGYVHSPVKMLSRQEIEEIRHTIIPPCTERIISKHYMPWLPRGSAQC